MTALMLRDADFADLPDLAAIHAQAFAGGEVWDPGALRAVMAMPGTLTLRAALAPGLGRDDTAACGFIIVRQAGDEAEILTLAVRPVGRRRGVASALVSAACARLSGMGVVEVYLEVSDRNDAARALYEKTNFHPCGRRKKYYADGADALVMVSDLRMRN